MTKVLKHLQLNIISDILLEYFKALFCFNNPDIDVFFAIK